MITSNITQLDEILSGGLCPKKKYLILGENGTDSDVFLYHFLNNMTSPVLYVCFSQNEKKILNELDDFSFSVPSITFVNGCQKPFPEVISQCKNYIEHNPFDLIVFDIRDECFDIKTIFSKIGVISDKFTHLVHVTKTDKNQWNSKEVLSHFDAIINVTLIEKNLFSRQYFSVKTKEHESAISQIPFRVNVKGVKIYIPKVIITGPLNSGKSSLIHSASTRAISVDRLGTTIALDHGHMSYKGIECDLFGTPGQHRFDPILKLLSKDTLGIILVVSATDPASYARAKDMLEKTKFEGLPLVIAVNKANLRGAYPNSAIINALQIGKNVPIVRLTAKNLSEVFPGEHTQLNSLEIKEVFDKLFAQFFEKKRMT